MQGAPHAGRLPRPPAPFAVWAEWASAFCPDRTGCAERPRKSLIKAGASNPVFILDEIDKVSADRQGDPSSALLEVLDPEQNTSFHDNFLDVDYDLSKVLFIATANNLNTIPGPLLDRMELIEVSGYITEEKIEIARKHLLPKELEANGLKKSDIKLPKETLEAIIESYTRESGVRELEKKIGKILRKSARQYATDGYFAKTEIKPTDLYDFLGAPEYTRDKYQGNDYAGVVTGLAWTAVGGEILFVETSLSRGKGGRLISDQCWTVSTIPKSAVTANVLLNIHLKREKKSQLFLMWKQPATAPSSTLMTISCRPMKA